MDICYLEMLEKSRLEADNAVLNNSIVILTDICKNDSTIIHNDSIALAASEQKFEKVKEIVKDKDKLLALSEKALKRSQRAKRASNISIPTVGVITFAVGMIMGVYLVK